MAEACPWVAEAKGGRGSPPGKQRSRWGGEAFTHQDRQVAESQRGRLGTTDRELWACPPHSPKEEKKPPPAARPLPSLILTPGQHPAGACVGLAQTQGEGLGRGGKEVASSEGEAQAQRAERSQVESATPSTSPQPHPGKTWGAGEKALTFHPGEEPARRAVRAASP